MSNRLSQFLDFLRAAEQRKSTLRSGYTAQGRPESTAEHTWRLCLMVMIFEDAYPGIDHHRLLKLCVSHDLVRRCRATSLPSTRTRQWTKPSRGAVTSSLLSGN